MKFEKVSGIQGSIAHIRWEINGIKFRTEWIDEPKATEIFLETREKINNCLNGRHEVTLKTRDNYCVICGWTM